MFGVYIHFPFCRKHCPFCDFAVAIKPDIPHEAYARAVLDELAVRAPLFAGRKAVSFYFGGGTPGLWLPECVGRVISALACEFGTPDEVTVECIPGELGQQHAEALRQIGVTRLSIGIESLDDALLQKLGRPHSAADAKGAVEIARAAGLSDLTADLMFALPGQSLESWRAELESLLALELPHVSLYQLTIEPGTPFARQGIRSAEGADPFLLAHDLLSDRGYRHYEVSSYARPGHEAIHNTLYWRGGEYLGLGMSAHSFRHLADGIGERFSITRDLCAYLACPAAPPAHHERLTSAQLRTEALWLWLRMLADGLPRASFAAKYGADPMQEHGPALRDLGQKGLLEISPETIRPTRRGMLLLDEVAMRLF